MEFWTNEEPFEMTGRLDEAGLDTIIIAAMQRPGTQITVFRPPHEDHDTLQRRLL